MFSQHVSTRQGISVILRYYYLLYRQKFMKPPQFSDNFKDLQQQNKIPKISEMKEKITNVCFRDTLIRQWC
jgi:hypothetical protein